MTAEVQNHFDQIDLFNQYIETHPADSVALLADVTSMNDVVLAARQLGFDITLEDANSYAKARSGSQQTYKEEVDSYSGIYCSFSVTASVVSAQTVAVQQVSVFIEADVWLAGVAVVAAAVVAVIVS